MSLPIRSYRSSRTPLVIGLTGPIGSGVSTAAEALETGESGTQVHRVRLSKFIEDDLSRLFPGQSLKNDPDRRVKLQDFGNAERQKEGNHYWVEKALAHCEAEPRIVIEGIRNLGEVEYLRERFHWFFLVAMDTPHDLRWSRVSNLYGGRQDDFERDNLRDIEEEDKSGQQVGKCVSDADCVIHNHKPIPYSSNRLEQLREMLMREIGVMDGTRPRKPDAWEVHMATAYAQSLGSQCLKRNVGAVIVDPTDTPLTLGFNENPFGVRPCVHAFSGKCFKDVDMFAKLEAKTDPRCPKCGTAQGKLAKPWFCKEEKCKADLKSLFFPSRNMELCTAIHAEERAIRNLPGGKAPGATMYVTTCPCFQCARYILDAQIKKVFYVEAYPVKESIDYLTEHKVVIEPFKGFKARAFTRLFKGVE